MEQTAQSAYGFISYSPAYPGGMAIQSETAIGSLGDIPSDIVQSFGFGPQNPLFWLLILLLIITGYISAGFHVGIKKIGQLRAEIS